jgi:hypothetical protein
MLPQEGVVIVTDRGRRLAAVRAFDSLTAGRPLPTREAMIRKRSRVPVDSVGYQAESRDDR